MNNTGKPWYLAAAVLCAFLDAYLPIVPNEVFLALGVMPRPKQWLGVALSFSLASALGAVSLAWAFSNLGIGFIDSVLPGLTQSPEWAQMSEWILEYGGWGLAFVALSPFPQHAAVILSALSGFPLVGIGIAVFLGRSLKYASVAWLAGRSPEILVKLKILQIPAKNYT